MQTNSAPRKAKMKIVYIAPGNSIHTQKWIDAFSKNHDVFLITMHKPNIEIQNCKVFVLSIKGTIGYYLNALEVHKIVGKIKPDIINVHYASGYGTLARMSKIGRYILNVWGSDVFEFPYESKIKMNIVKKNLLSATQIASTGYVMKKQVERLVKVKKDIVVTPFGIDTSFFTPQKKEESDKIIIGTVKTLLQKYGINYLIQAYNYAYENGLKNSELLIVGGGSQKEELVSLANSLPAKKNITFVGVIPHSDVPKYLTQFDIYVALSESESFGVAIVEAEACGIPVIVSDVGGLPEVVENNETGVIVPAKNYIEAGKAILALASDKTLRTEMAMKARTLAVERYDWNLCVKIMENLFVTFTSAQ